MVRVRIIIFRRCVSWKRAEILELLNVPLPTVADPFLYFHTDRTWYMFYEGLTSRTDKGDIYVSKSEDKGLSWQSVGRALEEPWHLSYPFVFRWKNDVSSFRWRRVFQGLARELQANSNH